MVKPVGCTMTGFSTVRGQCDYAACNYPFCEDISASPYSPKINLPEITRKELVLHGPCSIIKGLIESKVIPSDVAYPLTMRVNEYGLYLSSSNILPMFLEI